MSDDEYLPDNQQPYILNDPKRRKVKDTEQSSVVNPLVLKKDTGLIVTVPTENKETFEEWKWRIRHPQDTLSVLYRSHPDFPPISQYETPEQPVSEYSKKSIEANDHNSPCNSFVNSYRKNEALEVTYSTTTLGEAPFGQATAQPSLCYLTMNINEENYLYHPDWSKRFSDINSPEYVEFVLNPSNPKWMNPPTAQAEMNNPNNRQNGNSSVYTYNKEAFEIVEGPGYPKPDTATERAQSVPVPVPVPVSVQYLSTPSNLSSLSNHHLSPNPNIIHRSDFQDLNYLIPFSPTLSSEQEAYAKKKYYYGNKFSIILEDPNESQVNSRYSSFQK